MTLDDIECFGECADHVIHSGWNYDQMGAIALFIGIAISCIATLLTQKGPRRPLAIATLICLAMLGLGPASTSAALILVLIALMLVLISIVYWPIRSHWVNLPLISGAGTASLAMLLFAIY